MQETSKWLTQNYKEAAAWATAGIGRGTQDAVPGLAHVGGLPTRNFGEPIFEEAHLLSGERNYEMFYEDRDTCQACPISCKQVFKNEDDDPQRQLDPIYGGAEYEAMAAFGPACGVTDNLAVLKANELANGLGLDAISAGVCISFVMECFENDLISTEDTGGLEYRWGDADLLVKSVEMIAHRRDFGDVMAEGVARMSEKFGPETAPFDLTIKGQEPPMHEPRLKFGLGLGYAVAPVGADHMMNMHDTDFASDGGALEQVNSVLEKKLDPVPITDLGEDKMQIFFHHVNWMHFQDCAINCHFYPYSYQHLATALSGVTGVEYSVFDILDVGARAQTLSRLFNLREGFTADDDRLPKRLMKAFKSGPLEGNEITDEAFNWAKRRYYEMMGWNPDTGVPSEDCLSNLGLTELLSE